MCEGLVDLQGPHSFLMNPVGGDTPLLPEWPQADSPVWTARQALRTTAGSRSKCSVWQLPPLAIFAKQTWVPSRFSSNDFTLSVCPFSFISFAHVRGSHTLSTYRLMKMWTWDVKMNIVLLCYYLEKLQALTWVSRRTFSVDPDTITVPIWFIARL